MEDVPDFLKEYFVKYEQKERNILENYRIIFYQKEQVQNKLYIVREPKLNMFLTLRINICIINYHIETSLRLPRIKHTKQGEHIN